MVLGAVVNGETNVVVADDVVDTPVETVVGEVIIVVGDSEGAKPNRTVDSSSETSLNTYFYSTH